MFPVEQVFLPTGQFGYICPSSQPLPSQASQMTLADGRCVYVSPYPPAGTPVLYQYIQASVEYTALSNGQIGFICPHSQMALSEKRMALVSMDPASMSPILYQHVERRVVATDIEIILGKITRIMSIETKKLQSQTAYNCCNEVEAGIAAYRADPNKTLERLSEWHRYFFNYLSFFINTYGDSAQKATTAAPIPRRVNSFQPQLDRTVLKLAQIIQIEKGRLHTQETYQYLEELEAVIVEYRSESNKSVERLLEWHQYFSKNLKQLVERYGDSTKAFSDPFPRYDSSHQTQLDQIITELYQIVQREKRASHEPSTYEFLQEMEAKIEEYEADVDKTQKEQEWTRYFSDNLNLLKEYFAPVSKEERIVSFKC